MIPPEVSLPGPFNTDRRRSALAAYPLRVRAMIYVRRRTRTGTLWLQTTEPHGLRLSVIIQRLTPNDYFTGAISVRWKFLLDTEFWTLSFLLFKLKYK